MIIITLDQHKTQDRLELNSNCWNPTSDVSISKLNYFCISKRKKNAFKVLMMQTNNILNSIKNEEKYRIIEYLGIAIAL